MKIAYIDAQNIHKWIQEVGRIIDREKLHRYLKTKFEISQIKIFFGYMKKYQKLYNYLKKVWYDVVFKETMILPNWITKWNVDVDITIHCVLDLTEWNLGLWYILSGDGDYNTLVDLLVSRWKLWRVIIPNKINSSKLLRKSAWPDIQILEDIRYFVEKTKNSEDLDPQSR